MKFSFNKKDILEVLAKIQGITGRKTNLKITSDLLIKAVESKITITANDLETVFTGTYEAQVEKPGILSINSKKFFEIIREYPNENICINEVENRWVEIGSGDSVYHIVSSDYENFPETPVIENVDFIDIAAKDLKKMVTVSSVVGYQNDEKRIYVLGSLIEKAEVEGQDMLRIVSTDSRRLHCFDAPFTGDLDLGSSRVIIPKKGLTELGKFIDSDIETIKVGVKGNHFVSQRANESIMIKLLEGDYPDYKLVINFEGMIPIEVERAMFLTLMKRVSILTSEDYKSVIFNFTENSLAVTITNPEIGESKEQLMVGFSGEEIKSAFNPRYFMDALNLFGDEIVTLNIKDSKSPCIVKSMKNNNLICVIMSIHLS
ncbi:DNA polymerase III subunit beta [Desulfobacter hydrogenophilus]|uniref:Beta sliding clamp n=1 Tax=Desulfobacter hydrogenophilus TaxID=2291 RepID=A0A328FBH2_9BACT|nr:DNA polymerase III subunit beta [Desulfobacter hydrogenophilus]NDY71935.1 DNA polymerase III subunit beta [Desulfobacter hydrogenophilus]QBH12373.1 DNA polymerase III subunit beta [Desulfobacter hydrogenophilus]RAM02024.1 DNA polymerase III subunit beta [Desulfobacter hydrogenophilus]